jgi:hypothetical protein
LTIETKFDHASVFFPFGFPQKLSDVTLHISWRGKCWSNLFCFVGEANLLTGEVSARFVLYQYDLRRVKTVGVIWHVGGGQHCVCV